MAKLLKVLSYGAGLDSFALLVDSIQRNDKPDYCVFMETGQDERDGEWPGTYEHMEQFAKPLCRKNGITFVTIDTKRYPVRGNPSLIDYSEQNRSLILQGPDNSRLCTIWAKVERFAKWANQHLKGKRYEVWIGFEAGEGGRVKKDPHNAKECGIDLRVRNRFPLIERQLCRCRCEVLVRTSTLRAGGFPVPRKSACWYCPFSSRTDWKTLKRQMPRQFNRLARYEKQKGVGVAQDGKKRYIIGGKKKVWLEDISQLRSDPAIVKCTVCGRMPKATKAVGVDWLDPSEYVQLEDPKWGGLMMHGAVAEMPLGSEIREAIVVELGPSEDTVATWLSEWIDLEHDDHTLFFPADPQLVHEAVALLDNYIAWTRPGNDYTTATVPTAAEQAESLRDKLQFEASMVGL